MISDAAADRILGSLREADGKGIVRIEDRLDTGVDDVWLALTDPRRLARWIGEVEGDLRPGGEYSFRFFASGAEGIGRVEACEPPSRLLVTMALGQPARTSSRPRWPLTATRRSWSGSNGACRSTSSPATGPGRRSTSNILRPTWPDVNAAMQPPGSANYSLRINS